MGIIGTVAPGAWQAGKSALHSIKSIKVFKKQLKTTKAISRKVKLQGRVSRHAKNVKDHLKIQGSLFVGKYLIKKYVNDPGYNSNSGK